MAALLGGHWSRLGVELLVGERGNWPLKEMKRDGVLRVRSPDWSGC